MFKYDQFPILKLQVYNKQGHLHQKTLRQKSHKPYLQTPTHNLINVIDFETSEHLTLKTIYKTKTISKDTIIAEISNQQKINKQVYQDHQNIYIMMEQNYMNLQEVLEKRVTLFERQVQYIFCQLVTILENLRAMNIFHGGICLRNLYLDRYTMRIKLSGFGHSINLQKVKIGTHLNLYSETELTPYTAPELLDNSIDNPEMYYSGDIWSVGVVIYTLLIGEQPFTNMDEEKKLRTPSITKLKNYTYQFPTLSLSLNQQSHGGQIINKQPQQYRSKGFITNKWKQLLKQIFTRKQRRITLLKLIQHEFNMIIQSKFTELTCENVPVIRNHHICREEETGYVDMRKGVEKMGSRAKSVVFPKLFFTHRFEQLPSLSTIIYNQNNTQLLTGGELNSQILKICIQQQKSQQALPLICRQPGYIQKYCYIQKHNCIGYILQNNIGVIYEDGSCTIGQNESKYTYTSNQVQHSLEEILKMYIGLFDQFYGGGTNKVVDRYGTGGSESDYVNEQSSNNINTNNESISNSNNNTSRQQPKLNSSTSQPKPITMSLNHNTKSKKSKMLEIVPATHFQNHAHSNSNPITYSRTNVAFYQKSHHKLNHGGSCGLGFGKVSSTNQNLMQLNTPSGSSSTSNINPPTPISNTPPINGQFTKIGQSLLASSYYYDNTSSNSNKREKDKPQQITKHKYEIYKYFVQYFGDRVIDSSRKEWVIGFWKIKCGIVFLFSSGNWQINMNQGINKRSNDNNRNGKQNINQQQSAILIDKHGLAWWLKSNPAQKPTHEQPANTTPTYHKQCINNDYNYLCVKIARKIVKDVRELYVGEFENIMEPYCYR